MVLQIVRKFTRKYPVTRGMVVYAFLWPTANVTEQFMLGKDLDGLDLMQALRFGFYGTIWVAPSLFVWVRVIGRVMPGQSLAIGIKKAVTEQLVYSPFAITSFLVGLGLLEGKDWDHISCELSQKFLPVWKTGACYWPIVQTINFAYIKERNRVPFTAMFSFVWICFLSYVKRQEVKLASKDESRRGQTVT